MESHLETQVFMTDYCDAEMSAIEEVFPECKTYLCDFHREQCWERWVKDRKHGLSCFTGRGRRVALSVEKLCTCPTGYVQ